MNRIIKRIFTFLLIFVNMLSLVNLNNIPAATGQGEDTDEAVRKHLEEVLDSSDGSIKKQDDTGSSIPNAAKASKIYKIVLDPGHGGHDSGAVGYLNSTATTYYEKSFNLKIGLYTKAALEKNYKNVKVYMTRSTDVFIDLDRRPEIAEEVGADLFVSLHINSLDNKSVKGALIYAMYNCSFRPDLYQTSHAIGSSILNELIGLGFVNKGFIEQAGEYYYPNGSAADYLAVLRGCRRKGITGCLVEHGFISNQSDLNYLAYEPRLEAIGAADARGIAKYLGLVSNTSTNNDKKDSAVEDKDNKNKNVDSSVEVEKNVAISGDDPESAVTSKGSFYKLEDKTYFLLENNTYYKGWLLNENNRYYFGSDGVMKTGITSIGGKKYYFDDTGKLGYGFKTIGEDKYYFDKKTGVMVTDSSVSSGGSLYYMTSSGKAATTSGMVTAKDGSKYYVGSSSTLITGLRTIGTKKYYFSTTDGKAATGFEKVSGKWFYFNDNGVMQFDKWVKWNSNKYKLNAAGNPLKGWNKVDGEWYFFKNNATMKTGWAEKDGKVYYCTAKGVQPTGWFTVNGNKYFIKSGGARATGVLNLNGNKYLFGSAGVMKTGFHKINDKYYYFDEKTGAAKKSSWVLYKGSYYYLQANGVMAKGKSVTIGGKKYKFAASGKLTY